MEIVAEPNRVVRVRHPLIDNSLAVLRDEGTGMDAFQRHARLITRIVGLEVLSDIPTRLVKVQTPLEETEGRVIDSNLVLVPILRAGLAMLEAMSEFIPGSRVGFVGLERNEATALVRRYYMNLPNRLENSEVIILDPMLATGGSAQAVCELLLMKGAQGIRIACVVAAPEGIDAVLSAYPMVRIFAASIDRELSGKKYILPGLGDFGDRYFGSSGS